MSEYKTVHKWVWVWDFDKEEQWLNTMAQSGWALESVGFCTYRFKACEPGEYIIRTEMHRIDADYIRFMEETGAEYIGRLFQWIFFRKKASEGSFDIFSDIDSRIGHLNRIGKMLSIVGAANLIIGIVNSFNPVVNSGWLNLLCATVLMYALGRIHGKKESLERQRTLME